MSKVWMAIFATSLMVRAGTITTAFLLTCFVAKGDENSERFLNEYPRAVAKISKVYGNIHMTANYRSYRADGLTIMAEREEEYAATDGKLLVKSVFLQGDPDRRHAEYVSVANPRLSFRLEKGVNQKSYYVSKIDDYSSRSGVIRFDARPLFAPYGLLETTIPAFMKEHAFRITRMSARRDAGESLVEVNWVSPFENVHRHGVFLFSPDDSWALREYEIIMKEQGQPGSGHLRGSVEYQGRHDGVPLIKQIKYWSEVHKPADGGMQVRQANIETLNILSIRPGPVPEQVFTLPAFGLPEPKPSPNYLPRLVATFSLLLLALATIAFFSFRASKRSRRG